MFGDGPPKSAVSCQLVAAAGLNLVVPPKVSLPRLFLQSDAQLRLRKLAGVCYLLLGEQSTSSTSLTKLRSGWTYYEVVTPSSLSLLADPVANPIPKKKMPSPAYYHCWKSGFCWVWRPESITSYFNHRWIFLEVSD